MLAYFVVRHGDVDMYDKRDGAQRNAMQPSTRCTAQRKKHIIYSCNNIYNNFSRMFFSNFFYNSPISTVVIILPSQAMHMLRGKSLKVIFLWCLIPPSPPLQRCMVCSHRDCCGRQVPPTTCPGGTKRDMLGRTCLV